jgi:hypothetical protein
MIPVYIWGNHHCSDDVSFKDTFTFLIKKQLRFLEPVLHVKEEQCLSNKLIKRVQKIVNDSRGSPQVHLFVLGNIEKRDNIPSDRIVEQFEKLSLVSKSNEKIQFIITSVIPKNGPTDHTCLQLNELLKEKLIHNRQITFVRIEYRIGSSDYKDPETLNTQGSIKLAQSTSKAIFCIPRTRLQW